MEIFSLATRRAGFASVDLITELGSVNFDLFEMGGGVSNAVVGAEYREDVYYDKYDSLSESGTVLGSAGNSSGGKRNVYAAYFEWLFPFTSSFDITVAGRFDKYSDYGSDFSPKIAARWQPLDNLTFRGSYGQGFRAPGLDILTQADSFSAEPVRLPPERQTARLRLESRPKGKMVTVVRNLDPAGNDLPALAARLKARCGAGGTVKDGLIELQGDHLANVESTLTSLGYRTRRG